MATLRCTACDLRFASPDAGRSDFKCPRCAGVALFDWSEGAGDTQEGGSLPRGLWRAMARMLRFGG